MAGYPKGILINTVINEKFICDDCEKILRDPIQTYCGHRFCKPCVTGILSQNHDRGAVCNACEKEGIECIIRSDKIYQDRAIRRELKTLKVRCVNDGCDWTGNFEEFEQEHLPSCTFQLISCIHKNGCTKTVQRGHLADHLDNECEMRMIRCSYCDDDIVYINREVHFESCPKVIINCQFCTRKLEREKMTQHIDPEKGDCEDKLVHCDYFGVGCKEKAPRKMMGEHARRHLGEHLLMLLQTLIPFLTMVQNIEHQFEAIGTLESTVADHQKKIGRLENSRQAASENLSKLASCTVGNRTDGINPSSDEYTKTIRRIEDVVERLKNSLLVLQTKVSTTEGVTAVIGNQVEAVIDKVKSLTRNDENAKEVIESLERKVKSQDRIIAVKDVALAEQDIRIQALEMASFDGILLWKISNFSRKRNDAISGRTTSIYSPCFYTGRRGYKMCARIYLNGDGMGKGNHVSLFFVIMKGEFDALSRWPFRQKVTLMWLDQSNREDVIDAFRPDPTSDSFQRPNNDMNIASGCPLFMPLSQLDNPRHAYMKDDVAFIKICVDVSDLNCC